MNIKIWWLIQLVSFIFFTKKSYLIQFDNVDNIVESIYK